MKQNKQSLAITFTGALAAALAGFLTVYWQMQPASPPPAEEAKPLAQGFGASGFEKLVMHPEPRPLPEVVFRDATGGQVTLSEWRGKVVLLNLWATWCAPCKVEMPALDRLQAKLGGEAFEVIALSLDRSGQAAPQQFFEDSGIRSLRLFIDDSAQTANRLKAGGLPTSIIIDARGREVARLAGTAEWDEDAALAYLRSLIAK